MELFHTSPSHLPVVQEAEVLVLARQAAKPRPPQAQDIAVEVHYSVSCYPLAVDDAAEEVVAESSHLEFEHVSRPVSVASQNYSMGQVLVLFDTRLERLVLGYYKPRRVFRGQTRLQRCRG